MGIIIPPKTETQLLRNPNILHITNNNLQKAPEREKKISASLNPKILKRLLKNYHHIKISRKNAEKPHRTPTQTQTSRSRHLSQNEISPSK
jgi:hypothetical protein